MWKSAGKITECIETDCWRLPFNLTASFVKGQWELSEGVQVFQICRCVVRGTPWVWVYFEPESSGWENGKHEGMFELWSTRARFIKLLLEDSATVMAEVLLV